MFQKIVTCFQKIKTYLKSTRFVQFFTSAGTIAYSYFLLAPFDVMAANVNSNNAVAGIKTLTSLMENIVSAIGVFITLWAIFELGNAMQQHDAAQQGNAGKRLAGGIVMMAAPQLLKLFQKYSSVYS